MANHKTGTRKEWLAARLKLLKEEKELTRRSDELAHITSDRPSVNRFSRASVAAAPRRNELPIRCLP